MATWQYYSVVQDLEWLRQKGFPIISAAADYWVSRSEPNEAGEYEIRNVIGADEWNQNPQGGKNVNNNAYTNGVAKSTLEAACKAAKLLNMKSDPMWATVAGKLRFRQLANGVTAEHDTYDGAITKQADVCLLAFPLKLVTDKEQIRKISNTIFRLFRERKHLPCRSPFTPFCLLDWEIVNVHGIILGIPIVPI